MWWERGAKKGTLSVLESHYKHIICLDMLLCNIDAVIRVCSGKKRNQLLMIFFLRYLD